MCRRPPAKAPVGCEDGRELAVGFEQALAAPNDAALRGLFRADCHWRDVVALTGTIQTLDGRDAVLSALKQWAAAARPKGFRIAENRTVPRRATRVGTERPGVSRIVPHVRTR